MAEIRRKTRMYEPWGYQEENNYESSENQFEIEFNELFASAKYDDSDKKIHFYNNDGEELSGSTIDTTQFEPSSVVEEAYYDKTTKELVIKFSNGDEVRINMAEIIDENEFADGLQVNDDGIVSVKIDETSDSYLTVGTNGIKLSGVKTAIDDEMARAANAETTLDEKINQEIQDRKDDVDEINGRIDDIISGATPIVKLEELIEKLGYKDNETLTLTNEHEVAFGEWNISHTSEDASGQTIFSVGNGTSESEKRNAIEIMKNGDLYLWVEGEFMNVNKLLGQLAHEVYDTDSAHNSHFFDGGN